MPENKKKWCVYLLECADGTYYCGATNDLDHRLAVHKAGKGAKYTQKRLPVRLLTATRPIFDRSSAQKLEYEVKKQPKRQKVAYLEENG